MKERDSKLQGYFVFLFNSYALSHFSSFSWHTANTTVQREGIFHISIEYCPQIILDGRFRAGQTERCLLIGSFHPLL